MHSATRPWGLHASTFNVLTWLVMWPNFEEEDAEDGDYFYGEDED